MSQDTPLGTRSLNRRTTLAATAIAVSSAGCLSRLPFIGKSPDGEQNDESTLEDPNSSGENNPGENGDGVSDVDSDDLEEDDNQDGDGEEESEDDHDDVTLTTFGNAQYGYTIDYPRSWELDQNELSAVEAWHPDEEGFLRVTVHVAEERIDAEDALEDFIENTEANLDDVEENNREGVELATGHEATALSLWYDAGGDKYVSENIIATIDRLTYHAEFAVLEDAAAEVTEETIAMSLESLAVESVPSEAVTADELGDREAFEAEEGYSIEHPAGWEHQEVGEGHIRFDSPDADAGLSVHVVDDSDYPLEIWVESHLEDLEMNPDATLVDERDVETASGESAVLHDVEAENPEEGQQLITRELVTVADGLVAFVVLHIPGLWFTDDVESQADEIVTSIEF